MGREIELKTTINYEFLYKNHVESKTRISLLEGGSRSGKTWSIIQFIFIYCLTNKNKGLTIIIARDFLTSLRSTILPDFIEILRLYKVFEANNFNKSEMIYTLFGNTIRFMGLDNPDKVHGAKSNILWINEAISSEKAIVLQLMQRCDNFCIFDYNPSTSLHWVYDLELRDDSEILKTTILDNPFVSQEVRKQILSYEPTERNETLGTANNFMWQVYGLGHRADGEAVIFSNYEVVEELPLDYDRIGYGLDFGYSQDPAACIAMYVDGNNIYFDEILYSTGLLNHELFDIIRPVVGSHVVVPDSAEPKSCMELLTGYGSGGLNIVPAAKGKDSILFGLNLMKSKKIHITATSTNLLNEFRNYTFVKDKKTGKVTDRPIDNYNHGIDAARYITMFLLVHQNEIIV